MSGARKVAEKVHKLLALAESAAGTFEGTSAAMQARRLMDAHCIDEGQVAEAGDPMCWVDVQDIKVDWKRDLLHHVSKYCACKALFVRNMGFGTVYGRRSLHRWPGDNGTGKAPRFQNVSCSSCGQSFGPGNEGFSHCDNHADWQVQP